jgi:hypothetical protein
MTPAAARWPWILLPGRMAFFLFFQAVFAAGFWMSGSAGAWDQSAAWWPFSVTFTNLACLSLLVWLYRREGCRYWDIFRIDRAHVKSDLLFLLAFLVVAGPVAMLPNQLLARALFSDPMVPMRLFLAPLPAWAVYASLVLFPITQGLVEIPVYCNYIMPRLGALTGRPWLAYALVCLFLGIQHVMMPLRFNGLFIAWRLLMFIPFGFLVGGLLKWRPRLLPYLAVTHVLMDFATAVMYLFPI